MTTPSTSEPKPSLRPLILVLLGMVAVVGAEDVDRALAVLTARHVPAWTLGEVRPDADPDGPRAVLSGDHPRF